MDVQEVMNQARDALTVKRVFGEPYVRNGLTIIPVARVMGGGGGGEGRMAATPPGVEEKAAPTGSGFGGGFGVAAAPAGVYVVDEADVRWVAALDVNRIVVGAQVVAIVFLLVIRSIARARAKATKS